MYSQKTVITKSTHRIICMSCGKVGTYFNFNHLTLKEYQVLKDDILKVNPNYNHNICPNCSSIITEIYYEEIKILISWDELLQKNKGLSFKYIKENTTPPTKRKKIKSI